MKGKKLEHFWNKISLTGRKRCYLNALSTETPASHSLLEEFLFLPLHLLFGVSPSMKNKKVDNFWEKLMVRFECPKFRNPVSN